MTEAERRDFYAYCLVLTTVLGGIFVAPVFGVLFVPVPVAIYCVRGRLRAAMGILGAAAFGAFLAFRSFEGIGMALMTGALGLPIGIAMARRMHYGRIVALTTAIVFSANCLIVWAMRGEISRVAKETYEEKAAVLERADDEELQREGGEAWIKFTQWIFGNWANVNLGLTFTGLLVNACILVSLTGWWMRKRLIPPKPVGAFTTLRPPDWLVWVIIVTALLWFVDSRWPSPMLRMISWNAAFGLVGIYWLNGLAIFIYGMTAWRPAAIVVAGILLVMIFANLISMLSIVGLFDTWGHFRRKIDAAIAARNMRENSPDDRA